MQAFPILDETTIVPTTVGENSRSCAVPGIGRVGLLPAPALFTAKPPKWPVDWLLTGIDQCLADTDMPLSENLSPSEVELNARGLLSKRQAEACQRPVTLPKANQPQKSFKSPSTCRRTLLEPCHMKLPRQVPLDMLEKSYSSRGRIQTSCPPCRCIRGRWVCG